MDHRFTNLVGELQGGAIDRRTFIVRAVALGASAFAIGAGLRSAGLISAQEASELSPSTIGVPGVEHITGTDKGTINLYSSWPMTGASEQIGGDSAESVRLAIETWGGEAGGFAINYQALDDGIAANNGSWDAAKEAENATLVVNDADAMVYIATYNSGAAAVAIPILNQADPGPMPMISPANTAVGLTKPYEFNEPGQPDEFYPTGVRNYMRVVPADDVQGSASGRWAYNVLGARRAYVLHDNQLYGKGVATVFRNTFEELGGEILGFDAFDADAPSYEAVMTGIADTDPDLVYLGAIVNLNASKLLQDMRAVMPVEDVAFLGPDGLINQAFIDGAGSAAEGAYITFGGLPAAELTGAGATWYEQIKERVGHEPDAYSSYSFEAAVVALQAIDTVQEKDRVKILETMFGTEGFVGLLGTWSFTETGDTDSQTISLNVVKDGAITWQEDIGASE